MKTWRPPSAGKYSIPCLHFSGSPIFKITFAKMSMIQISNSINQLKCVKVLNWLFKSVQSDLGYLATNFNKNCIHKLWTPENNPHYFMSAHSMKKKTQKDTRWMGKKVTFDRTLKIIRIILELRLQIPKSADNCSIKYVQIILLPFLFYDQIMRIIFVLLNLWKGY